MNKPVAFLMFGLLFCGNAFGEMDKAGTIAYLKQFSGQACQESRWATSVDVTESGGVYVKHKRPNGSRSAYLEFELESLDFSATRTNAPSASGGFAVIIVASGNADSITQSRVNGSRFKVSEAELICFGDGDSATRYRNAFAHLIKLYGGSGDPFGT
ncbi:MAG: hypothetical protein AAGC60_15725 [Acidobacteriota bacterium]